MSNLIEKEEFHQKLREFTNEVEQESNIQSNPEDRLKRPVRNLLESFSELVSTRPEAQVQGLGARPDIGVALDNLVCGYIELKAPGKGSNPKSRHFTSEDRKQWEKLKELPNLIYTDGNEWSLYRTGERRIFVKQSSDPKLYTLLYDFLNWNPIVPNNPKHLAEVLAPLCRALRDDVKSALNSSDSKIHLLYQDWQRLLFPEADTDRFADAYAQTLSYALLLARLSGADDLAPYKAAKVLDSGHGLLAQTLRLLGQEGAREEMSVTLNLLERVIKAVDPERLTQYGDPWIYFYEDFLAAYDSKLRKNYGVYYTPTEVIGCQVRLCAQLLEEKFNKPLAYANEGVTFLDPATGTGAYPLAAMQYGFNKVEPIYGKGMVAEVASRMARNFYAFEYMVGPYAVAHLRVSQLLKKAGATFPEKGISVFMTDTLDDPDAGPPQFSFAEREIAEEHQRAQAVKRDRQILVCMGNPPYHREQRTDHEDTSQRKGGWVRFGDDPDRNQTRGILSDFITEEIGVHVKNLYNDYVYFWRWGLWKLYENKQSSGPSILSFITASSYLRGPGFLKMRRCLRETFDELWIIDLEGDNLGARKTENVFDIQTPVAIAIGVRYNEPKPNTPANVHYTKITGTREEKLVALSGISRFEDLHWQDCFTDWDKPLLPQGQGDYFSYPNLTDIFPWQHSGIQFKRKWTIGTTENILSARWSSLIETEDQKQKSRLFKETSSRGLNSTGYDLITGNSLLAISHDNPPQASIVRYAYRTLDRQWCFADTRVCDRPRPPLWNTYSDHQIFMVSLLTGVFGEGSAAIATHYVPDLHYFCGRGGKDVIPLWRDAAATEPNIASGLLEHLSQTYEQKIAPEDLFAYAYALLANSQYTQHFSEELSIPDPRLPLTKNYELFQQASREGKQLIWLHTYGERFVPQGYSQGQVPPGTAQCQQGVSNDPEQYPEDFDYDYETRTLRVGDGEFAPVAPEVWDFSVSGLEVVKSWLGYRMKDPAGKSSSPLDKIRPNHWTAQMTIELLELLWVIEHTLNAYTQLDSIFSNVIESECFTEEELPNPTEGQRKEPRQGNQATLF